MGDFCGVMLFLPKLLRLLVSNADWSGSGREEVSELSASIIVVLSYTPVWSLSLRSATTSLSPSFSSSVLPSLLAPGGDRSGKLSGKLVSNSGVCCRSMSDRGVTLVNELWWRGTGDCEQPAVRVSGARVNADDAPPTGGDEDRKDRDS